MIVVPLEDGRAIRLRQRHLCHDLMVELLSEPNEKYGYGERSVLKKVKIQPEKLTGFLAEILEIGSEKAEKKPGNMQTDMQDDSERLGSVDS